jgi:hypothetical protein
MLEIAASVHQIVCSIAAVFTVLLDGSERANSPPWPELLPNRKMPV